MIRMTYAEWSNEGHRLFGDDEMQWRFVCPSCGHVAKVADWKAAGAPESTVAFSCVGRWLPQCSEAFIKGAGPCNYAGGGLFEINPVVVVRLDGRETRAFAFDGGAS